ncbi:MAG: N-acetylmuramoyl-L-alanine amidase [Candidatus Paceibacterota bacterium]|jgi:N-acetylmuramoyl-L-alanine amidase
MRHYLVTLFAVIVFVFPWFAMSYPAQTHSFLNELRTIGNQLASVILSHNPKTVDAIRSRYNGDKPFSSRSQAKKVRILLVPGHEPNYGGAEFGSLKERNMTVELAADLRDYISKNDRYEIFVSRDHDSWQPIFADYFKTHADAINVWQKAHKEEIINLARLGEYKRTTPAVFHNEAPTDVALRLYGIDKWSNENDIDIILHIHFNDYRRPSWTASGVYSGFSIYVPEKQYFNSTTTNVLAQTIFKRLEKYNAVSDLPGEKTGIIEDQDLIAVGSYNSVNAASMLIEYGYIYEPQFADETIRTLAIKDLAYQTYLGLQDFFDDKRDEDLEHSYESALLPYVWSKVIDEKTVSPDVFTLQTALLMDGVYPPKEKNKNDCPRTGMIGMCTKTALEVFQNKYRITGEKGTVGPKTIEVLNKVYGSRTM